MGLASLLPSIIMSSRAKDGSLVDLSLCKLTNKDDAQPKVKTSKFNLWNPKIKFGRFFQSRYNSSGELLNNRSFTDYVSLHKQAVSSNFQKSLSKSHLKNCSKDSQRQNHESGKKSVGFLTLKCPKASSSGDQDFDLERKFLLDPEKTVAWCDNETESSATVHAVASSSSIAKSELKHYSVQLGGTSMRKCESGQ